VTAVTATEQMSWRETSPTFKAAAAAAAAAAAVKLFFTLSPPCPIGFSPIQTPRNEDECACEGGRNARLQAILVRCLNARRLKLSRRRRCRRYRRRRHR